MVDSAERHSQAWYLVSLCMFLMVAAKVHADQCMFFDARTAALVADKVHTGAVLLQYCEPCDADAPEPLRVSAVEIALEPAGPQQTNIGGHWYTEMQLRNGEPTTLDEESRKFILESMNMHPPPEHRLRINGVNRDLAYLYYPTGGDRYRNLGVEASCAQGVSAEISYVLTPRDQARAAPPAPHMMDITGQCFDGSCMLKRWVTRAPAQLRDDHLLAAPVVAEIPAGAELNLIRMLVEVTPRRAVVVFDHGRFFTGDEFYLLNSLGEGYQRVWHYGDIMEQDMTGLSTFQMRADVDRSRCASPSPDCWAETSGYPEERWWAQVETESGVRGWIRDPETVVESVLELQ